MILVDIQVPLLDRIYDFELDEEQTAASLIKNIVRILADREKVSVEGGEGMFLYAPRQENILDRELALKQQGVESGDRLILI